MSTHQKTSVRIKNMTSTTLIGAGVSHKYSDDYENSGVVDILRKGELSGPICDIDYTTGAFTTGRDWWLVNWIKANPNSLDFRILNKSLNKYLNTHGNLQLSDIENEWDSAKWYFEPVSLLNFSLNGPFKIKNKDSRKYLSDKDGELVMTENKDSVSTWKLIPIEGISGKVVMSSNGNVLDFKQGLCLHKPFQNISDWFTDLPSGTGNPLSIFSGFFKELSDGRSTLWYVEPTEIKCATYITDPDNFRGILDFFESAYVTLAEPIRNMVIAGIPVDPATKEGMKIINKAMTAFTNQLLNTESTAGFKQHILRGEDQPEGLIIEIYDNKVIFRSRSGVSETGIKLLSEPVAV